MNDTGSALLGVPILRTLYLPGSSFLVPFPRQGAKLCVTRCLVHLQPFTRARAVIGSHFAVVGSRIRLIGAPRLRGFLPCIEAEAGGPLATCPRACQQDRGFPL
jgi:hypothetical protein